MAWKETNVFEERMKFVVAWKRGGWSLTDLCHEFNISRVTGYKYLKQYKLYGIDGLKDKSRRPKYHPHQTRKKIIELILQERKEHPRWGARKLLASLSARFHMIRKWPHPSTVGRILKQNNLIKPPKRRIRKQSIEQPFSHALGPNDIWCADFKGHFTVGDGKRCTPLTVTDAYSRFLLCCEIVPKADTTNVINEFTKLFKLYGMPLAIRTDNGPPFASNALAGLSKLSVWWIKLGIKLERIEPGKPQQNGRHERMHKTLKEETALPPRSSLETQQKAFRDFQKEFNYLRPHEGIQNSFPANHYQKSKRKFPKRIVKASYPTNIMIGEINDIGNLHIEGHRIFLSSALADEEVGLEEISDRHVKIHFYGVSLGVIDLYTGKLLHFKNPMQSSLPSESGF